MKKAFLIAGLLMGSVLFANAQILNKTPEKRVAHQMKALQKNLILDPTQLDKINAILMARATKVDSIKSNPAADKKTNRQAMKAIMQSSEQQVTALLTADQQQAYIKFKEARKSKAHKHGDQATDSPEIKG